MKKNSAKRKRNLEKRAQEEQRQAKSVKVSVIIPCFNVEDYLRECLGRTINQTLKEIEIICIDDGSTDNSLKILEEYAAKDSRFVIISRENKGVGYSRNEGICIAKGEFISFMDPDDYYSSETVLEKLYTSAKKHNVAVCGGSLIVKNEDRQVEIKYKDKYNYFPDDKVISYKDYQYDYGFQKWIYNRLMLRENEIYFPNYRRFQDPPFMIKAMVSADKLFVISDYVYTYRWAHKAVNWTEEKIYHLLCGLRDDLQMAVEHKLNDLFALTLMRIKKDYKQVITQGASDRISEIQKEIMDICLQQATSCKTKSAPKVSVVLPIYNAEAYLRECLDSVTSQTLKDIEIICVNDGSTDNSLDIIKEYAEKDVRIRYIDKPNAGYGQTMNYGMKIATGEYIGIVEPDDFIKPEMYETLYNKAKELDLDIVKSDFYKFETVDKEYVYTHTKLIGDASYYNRLMCADDAPKLLTVMTINPAGIYKREFLQTNNIRHNETPGAAYQDNGFWVQTMYLVRRILFLDTPFYCYRQDNPEQSMRKRNNLWTIPDEYDFIDKIFDNNNFLSRHRGVYCYRKFLAYTFHLRARISYNHWEAYLERMSQNFLCEKKNGCLETKYFSQNDISDLNVILAGDFKTYIKKYTSIKMSIIIPVYNAGKYLEQCLDSTINQTLKDIEIICVDDGSTDNSLDILKEYAKKDKRVIVLTQKNAKQGAARNKALKIAKGQYIQFLDADDYLRNDICENIYKKMATNQLDMLSFSGINFDSETGILSHHPYYEFKYLPKDWGSKIFSLADCRKFVTQMAVTTWCTAYSHNFIKKNKIIFPEKLYFEDNVFFIKAILNMSRMSIDKTVYYYRRIHSASTMQNIGVHFADYIEIVRMILKYIKDEKPNFYSQYFTAYLNTAKWFFLGFDRNDRQKYKKELKKLFAEYNFKAPELEGQNRFPSWLLFPHYRAKLVELYAKQLLAARIDIKNIGNQSNRFEITSNDKSVIIKAPPYLTNERGIGQTVWFSNLSQKLEIKVIQSGTLFMSFKGQDKRFNGARFLFWVDYSSIKIDGREILAAPVSVWHDKDFRYEMPVKNGQIVKVEVAQQYHQYTKAELQDLILKLNSNSEYVKKHLQKIVDKVYRQTHIKPSLFSRMKKWLYNHSSQKKHDDLVALLTQVKLDNARDLQDLKKQCAVIDKKNNELKTEIAALKNLVAELGKISEVTSKNIKQ